MILIDKKAKVESYGVLNETLFNVKQENVAHIFSILRNQLYSDKIQAIIREYITNAIDAHVEANITKPITVTLPTVFSNEFIVRDYGKGLSKEDITEIFASYGASTKRQSNSFTGMLGIGSKSAFAYKNTFTIVSRHEGIETTYNAFIDESSVGKIAEINSKPTSESGISIHISISRNDMSHFHTSIVEFFSYIDYKPEYLGAEIKIPEQNIIISSDKWKFVKNNFHYNYHDRSNKIYFVMGNVTYKATTELLKNQLEIDLKWIEKIYNTILIIDIPIGKIKPSASRESLEYDQITKDYLTETLINLKKDLINIIQKKFDESKSDYEKHCTAYSLCDKYPHLTSFEVQRYQLQIDREFASIQDNDSLSLKTITKSFPHPIDKNSIYVMPNTKYIVYCKEEKVTHIVPRVKEYFEGFINTHNNTEDLVIVKFETKEHMDNFINHKSLQGAEFVNAISLPFTKITQASLKSENAKVYQFNRGCKLNFETWKSAKSITPDNAVYVEISSFKPKNYKNNTQIDSVLNSLQEVGVALDKIYGVKTSDIKSVVQPNWIELKDYLIQKVNQWKINNKDNIRDYEYFLDSTVFQKELVSDYEFISHLSNNLTSYYRNALIYSNLSNTLKEFDISLFQYNPPEEFERLYKRYPFLDAFQCSISYTDKIRLIKYLDMS